jgi:hypothetical protein
MILDSHTAPCHNFRTDHGAVSLIWIHRMMVVLPRGITDRVGRGSLCSHHAVAEREYRAAAVRSFPPPDRPSTTLFPRNPHTNTVQFS